MRQTIALRFDDMAATATIRVPRKTRDLLAALARRRGISLSSLLTEQARDMERAEALRSEREASRADAGRHDVRGEEREWEGVLGDELEDPS